MAYAYSSELPKYGVKVGLTNWSAAYCTGLLCARRLLTKVGLADKYVGIEEPEGEYEEVEANEEGPRPFKAFLDVGLHRTSTGARVFAAMKGASDGGIYIPHSERRFPGFDYSTKELDSDVLRDYIYGEHVAEYMRFLEEDDEEAFKRQFARYLSEGITADDLEDMYKDAHKKIRENPMPEKKERTAEQIANYKKEVRTHRRKPFNRKQRMDRVKQRKAAFLRSLGVEASE